MLFSKSAIYPVGEEGTRRRLRAISSGRRVVLALDFLETMQDTTSMSLAADASRMLEFTDNGARQRKADYQGILSTDYKERWQGNQRKERGRSI